MPPPPPTHIIPSSLAGLDVQVSALQLHHDTFAHHLRHRRDPLELSVAVQLTRPGQFVALRGDEVLGVGLTGVGTVAPLLSIWRHHDLEMWDRAFLDTLPRLPGGVRIRRHLPLPTDPAWEALDRQSLHLTALAVRPDMRRRGIGTALARARLDHAASHGAKAAFVTCILGSGSADLYRTLGFVPILELSPYYRDHSDMLLLGTAFEHSEGALRRTGRPATLRAYAEAH